MEKELAPSKREKSLGNPIQSTNHKSRESSTDFTESQLIILDLKSSSEQIFSEN